MNKLTVAACELCDSAGGIVLWQDELCRIVLVEDLDYAGSCRVIVNRHVSEMTDLDTVSRHRLMRVVFAVEQALRESMQPAKINLASLGNKVAHVHWHVIARFADDRHFPDSVWSEAKRQGAPHQLDRAAMARTLSNLLRSATE